MTLIFSPSFGLYLGQNRAYKSRDMHIHAGSEGITYPCETFQMCTSFRESRKTKQGGEWQGKASVQADGLLFLILVQTDAGEGFHRSNFAPLLHGEPSKFTAGSGQSLPHN